jgi:hypothetical protein
VEHDDPRFGVTDAHDAPLPADELPFSVIQRTRSAVEHVDLRINLGFGDERRAIRVNANPIYDENTEIVGAVLSMRDISEESA